MKLESRLKLWWDEVLLQEEVLWQQKYRVNWLQYGDRNTKFFHMSMLIWRRRNYIGLLQADDERWVDDQVELESLALSYFKDLYDAKPLANGEFMTSAFPRLPVEMQHGLLREYTKEEVLQARVWGLSIYLCVMLGKASTLYSKRS